MAESETGSEGCNTAADACAGTDTDIMYNLVDEWHEKKK
jgi:hypothetical protein